MIFDKTPHMCRLCRVCTESRRKYIGGHIKTFQTMNVN